MTYLIEGQLVDTYGGDYTFYDCWYEEENGEYLFFERCYGAKPSETEQITDTERISELMKEIKNK